MFIIACIRRPTLPTALSILLFGGCATLDSGRFAFWSSSKTEDAAEQSVLSPQQTADMQLALGRVAEQQQQWPAAAAAYRQVLQADPKHPAATHRLAVLYDRQGEFEQSNEWFQKALKLKPGDPELFCDIGYSLSLQGRLREAEINLRQAIAVVPDHYRAQNHLGVVLAQQGHLDQALAAFRRARCSPAQAHANLALVLAMHHRTADAQQHLAHARRLATDDQDMAARLSGLETLIAEHAPQAEPAATVATVRAAGYSSELPRIGSSGASAH